MKIFIIHLNRYPERKIEMIKQMKKIKFCYSFFNAIDGLKLTKNELIEKYSRKDSFFHCNRELTLGEIGNALTHVEIYNKIIKEKIKYCLIMEDDIGIKKSFEGILKRLSKLPKDWDVINFSTDIKGVAFSSPLFKNYYLTKFKPKSRINRASCYLINIKAAKKLLKFAFPIRFPSDGLLGNTSLVGIKTYGITPMPIDLLDLPTTLKNRRSFLLKTKYLSWAKKILEYIFRH